MVARHRCEAIGWSIAFFVCHGRIFAGDVSDNDRKHKMPFAIVGCPPDAFLGVL